MNDNDLYHGLDREALDAAYNNRALVPESSDIAAAWQAESARVRETTDCVLDISFGPSEAEKLDVFVPEGDGPFPVNVYLHGGYWYSRHKDDFSVIGGTLANAGALSIIVNYALIPEVDMAELVRQCRAAVAWAYRHAAEHGGDPERLYVTGHSAGGHLTAMMLATDWAEFDGLPANTVKGGVAISGLYDLTPMRLCFLQDTLGLSESDVANYSPLTLRPTSDAPLVAAFGGAESDEFARQTETLAHAWHDHGASILELELEDANHFTVLTELMTEGSALQRVQLAQMGL